VVAQRGGEARGPIELRVEYKRLNSFLADYIRNISKGGTFIRTLRPLDVGTEFIFLLVVPRLGEPLSIRGQVRWVKRAGEAAPEDETPTDEPGMGIRFLYASPGERARVEETVERLMIDSLGQLLYSKLMQK
jgi:type IV pilus assembly protein PilZ